MAKINCNSFESLCREIEKTAKQTLNTKVYELVADSLSKRISSDVYNTYTPTKYIRRFELKSRDKIANVSTDDSMIIVTSTAKPNKSLYKYIDVGSYINHEDSLLRWIEGYGKPGNSDKDLSGVGVYWEKRGYNPNRYRFMRKRRPVHNTQTLLHKGSLNKKVIEAFEKSFR